LDSYSFYAQHRMKPYYNDNRMIDEKSSFFHIMFVCFISSILDILTGIQNTLKIRVKIKYI